MANFLPRKWAKATDELPPEKRISTAAGMRLSMILNDTRRLSTPKDGLMSPTIRQVRQSLSRGRASRGKDIAASEQTRSNDYATSSGSTTEIRTPHDSPSSFSSKSELPLHGNDNRTKSGGFFSNLRRRTLLLILIVCLLVMIALVAGLAAGLKKKSSSKSSSPSGQTSGSNPASPAPSVPKNFPIGTYSMVTFLGEFTTNCTSIPSTWTCYPGVVYNSNKALSMATFDAVITAGSGEDMYQISSLENPLGVSFQNVPLKLLYKGSSTEQYQLQVSIDKTVRLSDTFGRGPATCLYGSTTFTVALFTQKAKTYPSSGIQANTNNTEWPFAIRAEEVVGANQNVPACYKSGPNGVIGRPLTNVTSVADLSQLCSCNYRNFS